MFWQWKENFIKESMIDYLKIKATIKSGKWLPFDFPGEQEGDIMLVFSVLVDPNMRDLIIEILSENRLDMKEILSNLEDAGVNVTSSNQNRDHMSATMREEADFG